ncbi:MAG: T3SS (YopN, CesT) and YbjN peptide-binding chaperone 1 [candidate division WOR-3 bacterium]
MSKENPVWAITHEKVKRYLHETFGDSGFFPIEDNGFWLWYGTTIVHVFVHPFSREDPKHSVVNIWSRVTVGTPLSGELAIFLIKANAGFRFGAFGYYEGSEPDSSSVIFEYNLLGEGLTKEQLLDGLMAVASTSDHYDTIITEKFGGKTMAEMLEEAMGEETDEEWE